MRISWQLRKLPGGGPWRISAFCPSDDRHHNTLGAAHGWRWPKGKFEAGHPKCTCPRAIYLKDHDPRHALARNGVKRVPGWWTGPWKIIDECPAASHNTENAARRGCVCPMGLILIVEFRRKNRGRKRDRRESDAAKELKKAPGASVRLRVVAPKPEEFKGFAAPDWTGGLCASPKARTFFDKSIEVMGSRTSPSLAAHEKAKRFCSACPLKEVCGEWALRQERPAGSWGGVYGGMSPFERAVIVKSRERDGDGNSRDGAVRASEAELRSNAGPGAGDPSIGASDGGSGEDPGTRPGGGVPIPARVRLRRGPVRTARGWVG